MKIRVIPANEYRRERWKNGLGWTREIVRARIVSQGPVHPATDLQTVGDDWDVRLSIAEIDRDCPFSAFPGVDRVLVLLAGEGMTLDFADGETVPIDPPHGRIAFAGERVLHCRLRAGPTRDFNVMWRRERLDVQVLHRPLVGPMVFFAEPGVTWAVHVLSGRAEFKDRPELPPLEPEDSALLAAADAGARAILDGGGELLLVRLEYRA